MLINKEALQNLKQVEVVEQELDYSPPGSEEKATVRIKKLSVKEADEIQKPFLDQKKTISMGEMMLSVVTRCLVDENNEPLAKDAKDIKAFEELPLQFVRAAYEAAVKFNPFDGKEEVEEEAKN